MATHSDTMAPRQQRSPLVIDVARLGRGPGSMLTVHEQVVSPSQLGLDLVRIPEGAELDLDLQVQSVSEGVLVTGTVAAGTTGECARCLSSLTGRIAIELTELFAYPDSATEATTDEDECGRVIDDTVDVEQAVIDAVGLELPLSPLCRPDCPGLCQDCGVLLADAEPGHHHDTIDPRWAKLAGMIDPAERGNDER